MTSRRSLLASTALLAALVPTTACLDHPLKDVELENVSELRASVPVDTRRKVDILFVIDDSGSMGEEQAALAANFVAFVEKLESGEVDADYRIGITTTDDGHPWCQGTSPEAGALQLRSCRQHVDDFIFSPGTSAEVDRRDEACLQRCPEDLADLSTLPTAIEEGGDQVPRPWLERGNGTSNVPQGVTTAQALACWGPQGIDGCGYESPLEAMRKALVRSGVEAEAGYGFMRDDALLQVVFITDEADCSMAESGWAAFDPEGSRALWPDPSAPNPPSAVCWNAGVSCETTADGRTHCEPADLDAEGRPAAEGEEVLHPVDRYLEILENIDEYKRDITGQSSPQVLVSVIAGVAPGYDGSPIDYGAGSDPAFEQDFGVSPGCSSGNGEAVPPVRLRAVADAFTEEPGSNLFSICDEDYSPALESIADILIDRLRPSCVDACVARTDSLVDGDLPSCTVVHEDASGSERVATCAPQTDGSWALPEGESLCVYAVTGDDLHADCRADGLNVELRFVRAQGVAVGDVTATCELSVTPSVDCG